MQQSKRTIKAFILLIALFLIGGIIEVIASRDVFLLRDLSSIYFITISIILMRFFARCVIDKKLRSLLIMIACMVTFWLLLRVEKYVAFEENITVCRYLWYAYYIPLLIIPPLSYTTAVNVGRGTHNKNVYVGLSFAVSVVFIIIVLTNDIHELVFRFYYGLNQIDDYGYRLTYYLIFVWVFALMLITFAILLKKCSIAASKKLVAIPIVYVLIFFIWIMITILGFSPRIFGSTIGEIPETLSFLMGGMWVLIVCMGLVPSNMGYGRLVSGIGLPIMITDADNSVIYKSPSAAMPGEKDMDDIAKKQVVMLDENTKLYQSKVSGGYAYWQVDISELNRINQELSDAADALNEENELIRLDNNLKEKQSMIDAKSKVYDEIAVKVLPESLIIDKLVNETKKDQASFDDNMMIISVYASYIKRMANLMLIASESQFVSRVELLLSINETARYLRKKGVIADVIASFEDDMMPSATAVDAYYSFWRILELAINELNALSVIISEREIKMTLEGANVELPEGISGKVENDDDISFISIYLEMNGGDK